MLCFLWEPKAHKKIIFSSFIPLFFISSISIGKKTLGFCHSLVTSDITMQSLSSGVTISFIFLDPIGFKRAFL
ncbi:hypothetical protein CFSAN001627_15003 [Clostridium botulinum CFSAN001627]|uniref:Uncharacterized protein n=1 Tax=Clostridium botulinum CFSAN001627 TaxID=1232189 RepID=M1ZPR9_CLOBO|nr:hypothetical protein CFSAN001627_15003 [Clostridium botulinum CFSAN001627]